MSDSLMTVVGIFLALILMFIFPLVEISGKNDEVAQTVVQTMVSEFTEKVAVQGKITKNDYDEFIGKLYSTGNSYNVELEAKILDDNSRRQTTAISSTATGDYNYYSIYTNDILKEIENGEYIFKKDDYIIVTVKNTNTTLGTELKNMFYKIIGNNTYTIGATSTATILNNGM